MRGSWSVSLASCKGRRNQVLTHVRLHWKQVLTFRQPHLEEVLHPLWVVAVALPADSLHFLDLTRFTRRLDVLEVNVGLLAEIDDGAQEVEQALDGDSKGRATGSASGSADLLLGFNTTSCKSAPGARWLAATYPHNS